MKKNVGKVDMIIRVIIGIVIASVGIVYESWWGLVAILPLLTAFINFCPLYTVIGYSTTSAKEEKTL
jgi:hypothetical protein